ncbi:MAG: hypothetical protein JST12_12820 [Armatimonadetes bacterium]|nr:hypothetical protein [Armatimonadota bacterium]
MKVGICISLEKAPLAVEAGFDYVELSVSEIATRDPWDTTPYEGLPIEACNLFFPGHFRMFDHALRSLIIPYFDIAKPRLHELGVQVAVIGSGNQRRCPDNILFPFESSALVDTWAGADSPEEVFARYMTFFDYATQYRTPIPAPESLERSETNVGTDCATFSRVLAKHKIGYTADAFHILHEWDANGREGGLDTPSKEFWADQLPHKPTHLHLAQLEGRRFPQPNDSMLEGFFARLRELGYDDRVSLECRDFEPADYKQAIANLKTYFA